MKYKRNISSFAIIANLFLIILSLIYPHNILASEQKLPIGTSSGTLTVDGVSINLKYAYAMKEPNWRNPIKEDVVILLTEQPLSENSLKDANDFITIPREHQNFVYVRIDGSGKPYNQIFDHPSIKGVRLQMAGSNLVEYLPETLDKDHMNGYFKTKSDMSMLGQKYSVNITFNAKILLKPEPQPSEPIIGMLEDISMNKLEASKKPKSEWIEAEKSLYKELLKNAAFDILIVPFQVQAYAIDRPGRSLMTRYFANVVESRTDKKIPDPTLVARALGQDARSFADNEVTALADMIKANIIIKAYVGHNCDEKMKLTITIQNRSEHGTFDTANNMKKLEWHDIKISDEHPPSEVFLGMLDEIASKLPFELKRNPELIVLSKKAPKLQLPKKIQDIFQGKGDSPIAIAYYLQLLGMLFPEHTTAKEYLFERSLIALTGVSPQSAGYNLIKSRAYFYLHRRPAALKVLGMPSTPETKAFSAFLNGNLPDLEKLVDKIQSPLHKLMAQVELNDLSLSYGRNFNEKKFVGITKGLPASWKMIVTRRLHAMDKWYLQSNLDVKLKMDEDFPVPGITAEIPVTDLSVYHHYRKALTIRGAEFAQVNSNRFPVEMDYLDLIGAVGEANVVKKVHSLAITKALPGAAKELLELYEPVYRGHPMMTYLMARVLYALSDSSKGEYHEYLKAKAKEVAYKAYYWSQGQTQTAMKSGGLYMAGANSPFPPMFYIYSGDYPKRSYWQTLRMCERKFIEDSILLGVQVPDELRPYLSDMELSLRYSQNQFDTFESLYQALVNLKNSTAAPAIKTELEKRIHNFADALQYRFLGNPERDAFLVKTKDTQSESPDIERSYKNAISSNPEGWDIYMDLALFYIKQGAFKKALTTFLEYPLFRNQQNNDRVKMSNKAYIAALELWWVGAISESLPLLAIAARSDTGSSAEMASSATIALMRNDFKTAASQYLQLFKRYNNPYGFRDYLALLHMQGQHDKAWSLINAVNIPSLSPEIWTAIFLGVRMQRWDDEKIISFLRHENFSGAEMNSGNKAIMRLYLIDRVPIADAKVLREVKWRVEKKWMEKVQDTVKVQMSDYIDAYYAVKKGLFNKAYELYKKQHYFSNDSELHECALPYIYWAAVKSGKLSELETVLKKINESRNQASEYEYYVNLSHAVEFGLQGHNKKAEEYLMKASYIMPATRSKPFFSWYQLVEICEWLYKETDNPSYKELALKWAKVHQKIQPMFAWAYAVEAQYSASAQDRLRALAIALYLDKNSERTSMLAENDKAKAVSWLNEHHPFTNSK